MDWRVQVKFPRRIGAATASPPVTHVSHASSHPSTTSHSATPSQASGGGGGGGAVGHGIPFLRMHAQQNGGNGDTTADRYKDLIQTITAEQFRVLVALSEVESETDALAQLAKALLNVALVTKTAPGMLVALLRHQVTKDSFKKTNSVLRGNSLATKMAVSFCKKIGREYMVSILQDLILAVVQGDSDMDLQVNPSLLKDVSKLATNQRQLELTCQRILNRIIEPRSIEMMPREIRAIAAYTSEVVLEKILREGREEVSNLSLYPLRIAGGFLFLRYFNPAIVSPEKYGLIPNGITVSPHARQNLITVSKVLQKLSNDLIFDPAKGEPYLACMNNFLNKNKAKCNQYLRTIITDPTQSQAWSDVQPTNSGISNSALSNFYHFIEAGNMKVIHRLLWTHKTAIMLDLASGTSASSGPRPTGADMRTDVKFLQVMLALGPPNEVGTGPAATSKTIAAVKIALPVDKISEDLGRLVNNPQYSDLTIEVEEKNIYCHCCILQMRAPLFLASLIGTSQLPEDESDPVVLTYDECIALLKYIYTGTIPPDTLSTIDPSILLPIAMRYKLNSLAQICFIVLYGGELRAGTVMHLLATGIELEAESLVLQSLQYIRRYFSAVMHAAASTLIPPPSSSSSAPPSSSTSLSPSTTTTTTSASTTSAQTEHAAGSSDLPEFNKRILMALAYCWDENKDLHAAAAELLASTQQHTQQHTQQQHTQQSPTQSQQRQQQQPQPLQQQQQIQRPVTLHPLPQPPQQPHQQQQQHSSWAPHTTASSSFSPSLSTSAHTPPTTTTTAASSAALPLTAPLSPMRSGAGSASGGGPRTLPTSGHRRPNS
eukprot:TRINITY_DN2507_c0_g1_i1.p1 TRINITY_DN2507_c0_g1~~TRINITY_DN2507_c0_g1_i1.p1  ORF type:complete len:830 (-),score=193.37 TRINITY_DN2507_c0_g1_i1:8-2497(-)